MPINPIGGQVAATLSNTVTGSNTSVQAAAVTDAQSGANLSEVGIGLLNNAGTFDRMRSYFGAQATRNTGLERLESLIILHLRALLMAQLQSNAIAANMNNPRTAGALLSQVDEMAFADMLKRAVKEENATPGAFASLNDPNGLDSLAY